VPEQNAATSSGVVLVGEHSDIEIRFALSMANGTLVEQTEEGETLRFTLGDGTFLHKLEELLIGLEMGTTATFTLPPEQAFGHPDAANYQTLSRSDFPVDMPLQEGYVIGFQAPSGDEIPGKVERLEGETVVVDFNHPLAGQSVVFKATIVAIHS
jgi:FKBP-type peptidyl-prolyl cis-trans isomerase SlpA